MFSRSFRLGEWIFEPITPLFESWLLSDMERRLHEFQRDEHGIVAPFPRHVVVNGWYFYSLEFLPISPRALARSLPTMLRRLVRDPRRVLVFMGPIARHGAPLYEREWREDLAPRYLAAVRDAEARVDVVDPPGLVRLIDELGNLAGEYFASLTVVAGAAYKEEMNLVRFWQRHLASEPGGSHLPLLAGLDEPAATPAHAVTTLDWWRPTYGELHGAGGVNAPGAESRARTTEAAARRTGLEARARAALSRSARRLRSFDRLLAECQGTTRVREEHVALLTAPWPVMRRALNRLGTALVDRGVIDDADDIFFLRRREVIDALASKSSPRRVGLVAQRRVAWAVSRELDPPLLIGRPSFVLRKLVVDGRILVGGEVPGPRTIVFGAPASPGRITGRVRIIHDPDEGGALQPGDVMVAPLTAPAWTPLFATAGGVVTDLGSALAHASVVAREYGIPAVVGCGNATRRLRDGQLVTVDGEAGLVEDAEAPA